MSLFNPKVGYDDAVDYSPNVQLFSKSIKQVDLLDIKLGNFLCPKDRTISLIYCLAYEFRFTILQ